jgi:hypothetical protein
LLEIHYLEFPRPREPLVKALGDQNQSLPVLILAGGRKLKDADLAPSHANGKTYFTDEKSIRQYLSTQYDLPHASE